MSLFLAANVLVALICVASAVYQWATYYRARGEIEQNSRHINSLRAKISYDEQKVRDIVDERLGQVEPESTAGGDLDPLQMMQMMTMMQGGGQQQPQQPPAPEPQPEQTPEDEEMIEDWEGWLTEPANDSA